MFLIDTNVWLEVLLEQKNESQARLFFERTNPSDLAITDFSLYSIGIILSRLKKQDSFVDFLSDTIEDSGVVQIRLAVSDLKKVILVQSKHKLDFDDAYQYVVAEKFNIVIVSFDHDFDQTERGRKTPQEIL